LKKNRWTDQHSLMRGVNKLKEEREKIEYLTQQSVPTKRRPSRSTSLVEDWLQEFNILRIPRKLHEKFILERKKHFMKTEATKFQSWEDFNSKKKIRIPFSRERLNKMTKQELINIGKTLFKQEYSSKDSRDEILKELKELSNWRFFEFEENL
jgi:hypothetical protein